MRCDEDVTCMDGHWTDKQKQIDRLIDTIYKIVR